MYFIRNIFYLINFILFFFFFSSRFVTLFYWTLTETTCTLITLRTFFLITKKILPFRVWIPYDVEKSNLRYILTFIHQTVAHVGAANVQIANETLICGLLIQASSQLQILKYRLQKVTEKNCFDVTKNLIDCVRHHKRIIEFVYR